MNTEFSERYCTGGEAERNSQNISVGFCVFCLLCNMSFFCDELLSVSEKFCVFCDELLSVSEKFCVLEEISVIVSVNVEDRVFAS